MTDTDTNMETETESDGIKDASYPCRTLWQRGEDKEDLFSDWTIVLQSSENEKRIETYHVHRLFLRDSTYFRAIFSMTESDKEKEEKTSRISLCNRKIDIFPFVLNYLYGVYDYDTQGDVFQFLPKTICQKFGDARAHVVAVLSLSRYFGIERLIKAAEKHIKGISDGKKSTKMMSMEYSCNNYCAMLSDAATYSEDDTVNVLLNPISRYYASSNTSVRNTIMNKIPHTAKITFQELAFDHLQKKYDKVIENIKDDEDTDELIDDYDMTWGSMGYDVRGDVAISGAGVIAVNGIYNYNGIFKKVAMYSKSGIWKGHEKTFLMYRHTNKDLKSWYISVVANNCLPLCTPQDTDFYITDGGCGQFSDSTEWDTLEKGTSPAPTVKYISKLDSDSGESD